MAESVEDIEGVLRLLAVAKCAELEGEEWADLADTGVKALLGTVEIDACDFDVASRGQGPIDARHDAGGDVFNLRGAAGARRVLDEEVHIDGKIAHDFLEACWVLGASFESLTLKFPREVSVLTGVSRQGDAEIDIQRGWSRQIAILSEVATKVFGNQATDEYKFGMPLAKSGPQGEKSALGKGGVAGVVCAEGFVFHVLQKPAHSRSAEAASGPRSPVRWRSR